MLGYGFLAVAIYEVQDGFDHYGHKFQVDVDTYKTAFFIWIGCLANMVAALKIYVVVKKNKTK